MNSDHSIAPATFVIRFDGEFDLSERERLTDAFGVATSTQLLVVDFENLSAFEDGG